MEGFVRSLLNTCINILPKRFILPVVKKSHPVSNSLGTVFAIAMCWNILTIITALFLQSIFVDRKLVKSNSLRIFLKCIGFAFNFTSNLIR